MLLGIRGKSSFLLAFPVFMGSFVSAKLLEEVYWSKLGLGSSGSTGDVLLLAHRSLHGGNGFRNWEPSKIFQVCSSTWCLKVCSGRFLW